MEEVTTARKVGLMVDMFENAGHTFANSDVDVKFKGQLQDLMG